MNPTATDLKTLCRTEAPCVSIFLAPHLAGSGTRASRTSLPAMLPRDERTTTLTDVLDGDRNLHFVPVNKTPKGRTCRACHETHAGNSPSHIRESVPFGNWPLAINFVKKENGGPGCHAPVTYDRKKTSTATVR